MAQFLTRVELHGAKHGDGSYDTLHAAMASAGFLRTIPTVDRTRQLPTAEYFCEGPYTKKQVFDAAKSAADTTGKTSDIITAEMAGFYTDCKVA